MKIGDRVRVTKSRLAFLKDAVGRDGVIVEITGDGKNADVLFDVAPVPTGGQWWFNENELEVI